MDDSLNPFARESAREAITAKRDRILGERSDLLEQRGAILLQLRELDRELSDCRAAARLFDLEIDFPDDDDRTQMARREAAEYEYRYLRLRERHERNVEAHPAPPPPATATAPTAVATVQPSARVVYYGGGPAVPTKRPAIRDIVVEQLQLAAPLGRKAADLRAFIEKTYGEMIHEKTVGMTLYRLSKDRLVHRDGHTWFFGPAKVETENPGAATPGLEDLIG